MPKIYSVSTFEDIKSDLPGVSENTVALLTLAQSIHDSVLGDAGDLASALSSGIGFGLTGNSEPSHLFCHPVTVSKDEDDYEFDDEFDDDEE